jgi:ATP-binding cassette subfamily F protein uup
MRREIAWLARGAKARTTKAKGRIQEAGRMAGELAELQARNSVGQVAALDFVGTQRQTRKLLVAEAVSKTLGGRVLFENLNLVLGPGMKLGLVGPNGVGKSTLIKILAGEMEADSGSVRRADQLKVVLFDQARRKLDQNQTLKRALSPGGETVIFRGQAMHVSGWARRFLFRTEQLDMLVSDLSGGEQARILIAAMMLRPADLLILDEPTNDLDIPSLEVLEESLADFPGALVLVTHDRYLLESLSTDLLALDGRGNVLLLADLSQYERAVADVEKKPVRKVQNVAAASAAAEAQPKRRKLSYLEQREWDQMETKVLAAEALLAEKQRLIGDAVVMADHVKMAEVGRQLAEAQKAVEAIYRRWEELEGKRG